LYTFSIIASFFNNYSYRKRTYKLRFWRSKLISDEGFDISIFPAPGDEYGYNPEKGIPLRKHLISRSPSVLYFYMITIVSALGIIITLIKGN